MLCVSVSFGKEKWLMPITQRVIINQIACVLFSISLQTCSTARLQRLHNNQQYHVTILIFINNLKVILMNSEEPQVLSIQFCFFMSQEDYIHGSYVLMSDDWCNKWLTILSVHVFSAGKAD